jgi:hypothetical protein
MHFFFKKKNWMFRSTDLFKMGKFEMLLSNFCPLDPIKGFTSCLHKPVVKR